MRPQVLKHLADDAPRVMVVDGSKLVRKLIADVLKRDLPNVQDIRTIGRNLHGFFQHRSHRAR